MSSIATYMIVAYCVLGALLLLVAIKRAPRGYEDEKGFHLGTPPWPATESYVSYGDRVRRRARVSNPEQPEGARPPWPLAGVHEQA
jgi:hypothetical protein